MQIGELFGAGVWPFAISIILFSLVIDRIGYKIAMYFSFVCYALYGLFASLAYAKVSAAGLEGQALLDAQAAGFKLLYTGSIILGLGNGTVEAFINPVVATLFRKEKTKWLNILHAGWPGGLVIGGIITMGLSGIVDKGDWRIIVGIIVFPAVVYLIMLAKATFPVNERVQAGASYKDMLAEFGVFGAFIAAWLVFSQLAQVFVWGEGLKWGLIVAGTVAYGVYCRSLGNPVLIVLIIIMMPLAVTELGTDGWITGLMEEPMKKANANPAWVLVYTSFIMMILRFFTSGFLVKKFSPLGLLGISSVLAICGLFWLSSASGITIIFAAATLYGFGKTFFWPTMLGIVSEQCPKGGALTLNAIAGIGMLSVGIVGSPLIGYFQEDNVAKAVKTEHVEVFQQIEGTGDYVLGTYSKIDADKLATQPAEIQEKVGEIKEKATQAALSRITIFPIFMLVCYLGLIFFFKSRGGYKAVDIVHNGGESTSAH
ncbi:MAG: MFS transporter [Verrucomicrobia bacterium]|nr:MFS transporter [Verrucomicrobiota bacterium]